MIGLRRLDELLLCQDLAIVVQPLLAVLIAHIVLASVLLGDVACKGASALQVRVELLAGLAVRVLVCRRVGQTGKKFVRLGLVVRCLILEIWVDEIVGGVDIILGILG